MLGHIICFTPVMVPTTLAVIAFMTKSIRCPEHWIVSGGVLWRGIYYPTKQCTMALSAIDFWSIGMAPFNGDHMLKPARTRLWIFFQWNHAKCTGEMNSHDDVIKGKRLPCCWPFVRRNHRSPVNSLHKVQWRGVLMFYLVCAWTNGWVNSSEAGDLRRHRAHYDVNVMLRRWASPHKRISFADVKWMCDTYQQMNAYSAFISSKWYKLT